MWCWLWSCTQAHGEVVDPRSEETLNASEDKVDETTKHIVSGDLVG